MEIINMSFRYIDLFAGIGGFRIALDQLGGECVFSCEIDREAAKTYYLNFGETPLGDITSLNLLNIPQHDILCAGFPCQPFSISGKQKGFEDTRGTLFFYIMEIINIHKPRIVFLENVKHLQHHDEGRTLRVIIRALGQAGYNVSWKIMNAKDFGLAQNRERIIIIGSLDKKFHFDSIKRSPSKVIRDILDSDGNFEFLTEEEYTIIPKKLWKKQESGLIFVGYRNKSIRKAGVRENTQHLSRVHKQPNRIYHVDGTHPTLPSQETSGRYWIYDDHDVRKLTLNECTKLMGFPEIYKWSSPQGTIYKQIGNSVAIPMIKEIGQEIINQFLETKSQIPEKIFSSQQLSLFEAVND